MPRLIDFGMADLLGTFRESRPVHFLCVALARGRESGNPRRWLPGPVPGCERAAAAPLRALTAAPPSTAQIMHSPIAHPVGHVLPVGGPPQVDGHGLAAAPHDHPLGGLVW